MADVTGPVSTLPGHKKDAPDGASCDECGATATKRVQGETDSFGAEWIDVCDEHLHMYGGRPRYHCQKCKQEKECVPRRDHDEGSCGTIYWYCTDCVKEHDQTVLKELQEELDYWESRGIRL